MISSWAEGANDRDYRNQCDADTEEIELCPHGNVTDCSYCRDEYLEWVRTVEYKPAVIQKPRDLKEKA